ncbi:asparagine synthase C-terminal domain-containing protein [Ruania zhangjianzhongii]|uniref:asparagine synthase-related protein n=1 Tax=Ruania zhangjianzhongii TaxID=2603206 RepID=UPI00143D48A1|nr:asparagine synthase C-terminal domain-containing protein [Ruania zhangjianzhongii]
MLIYQRLTDTEVGVAAPLGSVAVVNDDPAADARTVRAALERAVTDAVSSSGPCYVLFSGGRDSSLILALATHAARQLGADDPVPVTAVYPGDEQADETDWQDLVLEHLGLTERLVLSVTDERSTLGELATTHLRRRGLVWPEAVHTQPLFFAQLGSGTVLTGEGGDAFLEGRRVTPLFLLRRRRRLPSLALLRAAGAALLPAAVVRAQARRTYADPDLLPWLRPAAREILAADEAALRGPLRWDVATWAIHHQRTTRLGLDNAVVSAAEYGLTMRHPIAETAVVAALAAEGGGWGFPGRTHLFRRLGADLLPDAVLARRSKAAFNASRWAEPEREFARSYTGGAFDPDLIDDARLQEVWLSPRPHPVSYFLAQIAWLHQHGLPQLPRVAAEGPRTGQQPAMGRTAAPTGAGPRTPGSAPR